MLRTLKLIDRQKNISTTILQFKDGGDHYQVTVSNGCQKLNEWQELKVGELVTLSIESVKEVSNEQPEN